MTINNKSKSNKIKKIISAKEALELYDAWYNKRKNEVENKKFFMRENNLYRRKPVLKSEIIKAEKRLGLKLPPSYSKFVTETGVFNFGEADNCESAIDKPSELDPITVTLESEFDMVIEDEFSQDEIALLNKIIRFSFGDESRQLIYCYLFRLDLRKGNEGEAIVDIFDQDEIEYLLTKPNKKAPSSFDEHINRIVEEKISKVEEYIKEGRYSKT